jgi:hypothetical protein
MMALKRVGGVWFTSPRKRGEGEVLSFALPELISGHSKKE